jgi:hypothetical protein
VAQKACRGKNLNLFSPDNEHDIATRNHCPQS